MDGCIPRAQQYGATKLVREVSSARLPVDTFPQEKSSFPPRNPQENPGHPGSDVRRTFAAHLGEEPRGSTTTPPPTRPLPAGWLVCSPRRSGRSSRLRCLGVSTAPWHHHLVAVACRCGGNGMLRSALGRVDRDILPRANRAPDTHPLCHDPGFSFGRVLTTHGGAFMNTRASRRLIRHAQRDLVDLGEPRTALA